MLESITCTAVGNLHMNIQEAENFHQNGLCMGRAQSHVNDVHWTGKCDIYTQHTHKRWYIDTVFVFVYVPVCVAVYLQ